MGLQGSLGDSGSFFIWIFLADATPYRLFFEVFVADAGILGSRFMKDFGDSEGEDIFLDLEEGGLDDMDKFGDLESDLCESGGLGVTPGDCGFGDDEGVLMSFKSI